MRAAKQAWIVSSFVNATRPTPLATVRPIYSGFERSPKYGRTYPSK
ncbi:hypothetical protein BH11MYX1_BH11MYX1_15340 [soil metagenome]